MAQATTLHTYNYTFEKHTLLSQVRRDGQGTVTSENPRDALNTVVNHLFRRPAKVEARVTIIDQSGSVVARWASAKLASIEFIRNGGDPKTQPGYKASAFLDGLEKYTSYPITEVFRE